MSGKINQSLIICMSVCVSVCVCVCTWQDGEIGAAVAVSHSVGPEADVHARVLLFGPADEQLVEVGAVGPRPHLSRRQHHEPVLTNLSTHTHNYQLSVCV